MRGEGKRWLTRLYYSLFPVLVNASVSIVNVFTFFKVSNLTLQTQFENVDGTFISGYRKEILKQDGMIIPQLNFNHAQAKEICWLASKGVERAIFFIAENLTEAVNKEGFQSSWEVAKHICEAIEGEKESQYTLVPFSLGLVVLLFAVGILAKRCMSTIQHQYQVPWQNEDNDHDNDDVNGLGRSRLG